MERQKISMGEPVDPGSSFTSEEEAIKNASFGAYSYDPTSRLNQMNQVQLPGWQGVSTSMNPNGFYAMNPPTYNPYMPYGQPVGLGANPYMYNNPYYQPNPAFGYMNSMMYQPPQQQNLIIHIPAVNMGGEFLPPIGFEEKIDKLKQEYWVKEQEESVRNKAQNQSSYYGMNYYGMPYYNNYYSYNSLRNEVDGICREMMDEARENRRQFNIRLSKMAYSYLGKEYNEQEIIDMHTGRDIENPYGMTMPTLYNQNKLLNLVPFDNSAQYQNHSMAVSAEHAKFVDPNSNMLTCFDNIGLLGINYALEEEQHRRRDCSSLYDSTDSGYRYFVKKKALERMQNKDNGAGHITAFNNPQVNFGRGMLNQFGTLSNIASLTDDGTLNIACNFGSKAGQIYSVNQNEAKYEQDRARFNSFLNTIDIPGVIKGEHK